MPANLPMPASANAALEGGLPILLGSGISVENLTALRDTLETQRAQVEAARNGLEGSRANIEQLKAVLLERLNQFNNKLPALGARPVFPSMLEKAYSVSDGMGKVLPPLDGTEDAWEHYQAEGNSIVLRENYALLDFSNDVIALKAAYKAYGKAQNDLLEARGKRDETQEKIKPVLVQYRKRIASDFAEGSAILEGLPAYSPPDTGRTPDAVELTGTYNPATRQSDLAWSAVTDEDVVELELRASAGPEYDAEDESVIATFLPTAPRTWSGTFGLLVPGTAASFKLYSKTAEGREKRSNPVTVTRPV